MVAGGGASVVYSDTICDLGGASELANYGEYSGAPSEQQTYEYAKTILSLMTQEKHPQGKVSPEHISNTLRARLVQKIPQVQFFSKRL
jgi:Succinyl-CoA synthetase, beta subunit